MKSLKYILTLVLAAISATPFAAVNVAGFANQSYGNIPYSSGWVDNVRIVTASTVVTVTVPPNANQVIIGGDDLWVADDPSRTGAVFPTTTVSRTGWIPNPQGRLLLGNCSRQTPYIYVYARQLPSSGVAIGSFEWSNNGLCN